MSKIVLAVYTAVKSIYQTVVPWARRERRVGQSIEAIATTLDDINEVLVEWVETELKTDEETSAFAVKKLIGDIHGRIGNIKVHVKRIRGGNSKELC